MAARFCRICRAPAAEGSVLCAEHRAQAAQFSRAGASEPPAAAGAAPASGDGGDGARPAASRLEAEPADRKLLREEVAAALAAAVDRMRRRPDVDRHHPEIAVYVLDYRLHARAYYATVAPAGTSAPYDIGSPEVAAALAPGGVLFDALERAVGERRSELEGGSVLAVSLELLTHAGIAVLTARRHAGRTEIARFRLTPAGFARAA